MANVKKFEIVIPKQVQAPAPQPQASAQPAIQAQYEAPSIDTSVNNGIQQQNSVFDETKDKDKDKKKIQGYNDFTSQKEQAGIKTTSLREGEVNFAEYGAALSEDLKQQIIDSFDCEADYVLQQEIAGLFAHNNCLTFDEFVSALEDLGYEVPRESVNTSYIIDDKKSASHGGGQLTQGNITVFTIIDPSTGAEIKIADTNGNGAIESEEVFMNELLTGISKEIDISNIDRFKGVIASNGAESALLSSLNSDGTLNLSEYQEKLEEIDNKGELDKERYDKVLEAVTAKIKSLNLTSSDAQAESLAKQYMQANYDISEVKNISEQLVDGQAITAFVKNNTADKQFREANGAATRTVYETAYRVHGDNSETLNRLISDEVFTKQELIDQAVEIPDGYTFDAGDIAIINRGKNKDSLPCLILGEKDGKIEVVAGGINTHDKKGVSTTMLIDKDDFEKYIAL